MDLNFDDTKCPKCGGDMHSHHVVLGGHADFVAKKCDDTKCGQIVIFIVPPVGKDVSITIDVVKTPKS